MRPSQARTPGSSRAPQGGSGSRRSDRAGRASQSVKAQAAEQVSDVTRKVRERGERLLAEQKHRAATELEEVGRSIRRAAGQLRTGPLEGVGGVVEAAADGVTRASQYLDEQDLATLVRDAENAIRRVPQWFLPGMFVAGLVLARFAKASENGQVRRRANGRRAAG